MFNAVKSGSIEAIDILLTNGARTDIVAEVNESFNLIFFHSTDFSIRINKCYFVNRIKKLYSIVLVNLVKLKCLSFGLVEEIMM